MENTQLFIPKNIKVGYQKREDTYTKKLAYVIYYDAKNVLRKQTSWDGWRDKKIAPNDFENVPTEGFVLNKRVGGYSSGWNHRNTYCRVYDPRGFEFEISIENLLFILQESSSIKGKGLEGQFVYSWDGKELVLLPVDCDEYKKCTNFTKLQENKVSTKDLIVGATYLTKKEDNLIFIGRFNTYKLDYIKKRKDWRYDNNSNDKYDQHIVESKSFVFYNIKNKQFELLSGITTLSNCSNEIPVDNYAELMDKYDKLILSSKPIGFEVKEVTNLKTFGDIELKKAYDWGDATNDKYFVKLSEDCYIKINFRQERYSAQKLTWHRSYIYKFENGVFVKRNNYYDNRGTEYKQNDVLNIQLYEVKVKLANNKSINLDKY